MAFLRKKSEFRPDSSIRNWTQRLYLSPQQQKRYLKWILLAVLSVLSLLLQDVLFSRISIYGSTVDLVPCALIVICVMQGIESGCVFLLIGALVYYFSGSSPGVYVILLIPVLGCVAAAFRQAYLRKGFRTTMMCSGIAVVLYEIISFLAALILGITRLGRFNVILGTAAMSLLSLPVLFLLVRGIAKIGGDSWKE